MIRSFSLFIIHLLILIFTTIQGVNAQAKRLQFKQLTPDDGLSSSIITAIIQDYEGLMWIGTSNGLNKYDGFSFTIYKNNAADSSSLIDNVIQTIFEDHNKKLFIGTEHGLCLYDREKDSFLNYMYDKSSPLRGIDCSVSKIVEDTKGNLWLGTNLGLIYFDRIKNSIIHFVNDPDNPESLSNNIVESVLFDKYGRLWVATRKGLNRYLPESRSFEHYKHGKNSSEDLSNTVFGEMTEDREGNLWFGSTDGLFSLKNNPAAEITGMTHYRHDNKDKSSLSIDQVTSLFVDDTGNLWIGTENGGINLFDKKGKKFVHYRRDDYNPQSLNNESIEVICQDKSGNLWFGTYTGGLNIAVKNRDAIIEYQTLPGAPFSLSHNTVTCFLEDHNNKIWVGTDGGGLNLFDPLINRFSHFDTENSDLSSNAVLCLVEDSDKMIWLGTWAGGLVSFDIKTGSFKSLNIKNSTISDNSIYSIAVGSDNDLWLGSFEHGLIHYEIKNKKFTSYTAENSGLTNDMVVKIAKYSKDRLLIGTSTCLQIFTPASGKFITYNADPRNENSLSNARITDMLVENDTSVWVGTPDGLNRFNPVTGSFTRYFEENGLPDNFIKGLELDNSGALWVTTNGGVCRFDYKAGKYKNFTNSDGLQSNEFSERSILKIKSGFLLMGGTKGFNMISPEEITENISIPNVLITDLKIFNKSVKPGTKNSALIKNITETNYLILPYHLSVLTFSFAVLDFSAPEKNQFAYKMENFDKDWIYPGNKGEATYTNLNQGDYVFRVKGSNNDGIWNDTGTSIRITILPPWWGTWWFRSLMLFAIVLVLVSIYLLRVRQFKRQKILLEQTVAIKTAELHELNASKDKFFSIIAHDLKNPFNTIVGFSDILKEDFNSGNGTKVKEYAGMINSSAIQTLKLLENLLDWANSQRGKIIFTPVSLNLNELFVEELSAHNDMAAGKNIKFKSFLPDSMIITADRNMLKTILRNMISNAIKFTPRNGIVEINSLKVNGNVEISVSDNGIGMNKEKLSKLFRMDSNLSTPGTENESGTGLGLLLCKEFVEKHGGTIIAESEPGKGSHFKISLPQKI